MTLRVGQVVQGVPWYKFKVIEVYTRAQAFEDGVLVDISEWAREYGFVFPVAVNNSVWSLIEDPEGMKCAGQSVRGRGAGCCGYVGHVYQAESGGIGDQVPRDLYNRYQSDGEGKARDLLAQGRVRSWG